jgi:GDSL-like Lipase/Acylhydrolase family
MRKALLALAVPLLASLPVAGLPSGAAQAATHSPTYYVSLGDSYSVGYQPGLGSTPGYTAYVAKHTRLSLVNFGCGGATTTSILSTVGCAVFLPHTAGGTTYPTTTQIAAADAFLTAHRGHVGLITVIIGGLEVTGCAVQPDPVGCLTTKVSGIYTNVATLASDLRAAAGPKVPIIGLTYPDSFLGGYVWPKNPPPANAVNRANLSVTAFESIYHLSPLVLWEKAKGAPRERPRNPRAAGGAAQRPRAGGAHRGRGGRRGAGRGWGGWHSPRTGDRGDPEA